MANKPLWQDYQRGIYGENPPSTTETAPYEQPFVTSVDQDKKEMLDSVQAELDSEFGEGTSKTTSDADLFGEAEAPSVVDQLHFGLKEAWLGDKDALLDTTKGYTEKYFMLEKPEEAAQLGIKPAYYERKETEWQKATKSMSTFEQLGAMLYKSQHPEQYGYEEPTDEEWILFGEHTEIEKKSKEEEELFIKKYYGEDWLDITPEERRGRMDEKTNTILQEQFPDIMGTEYAHSLAAGIGNMGVVFADPLTYVAPAATSYKLAAGIGASYGAIDAAARGLATNGYISAQDVGIGIVGGSVFGVGLRAAGKGAVKGFSKLAAQSRVRAGSKVLNEYEKALQGAINTGADWNEAVMVARLSTGIDGPTTQNLYEITGRVLNLESMGGKADRVLTDLETKASNSFFYRHINTVGEKISPFITPITDVLRDNTPRIFQALRANDAKMHFRMHTSFTQVKPWLDQFEKMSLTDQKLMQKWLRSGDKGSWKEASNMVTKYMREDPDKFTGYLKNWRAVRSALKETADDYINVGHDMKLLKHYFPRVARDAKGLGQARIGWLSTQVTKAAKEKGSALTPEEIGTLFTQATARHITKGNRAPVSGNLRPRMNKELSEYLEAHYASPAETLHSYFRTAARDIERAGFFNKFVGKGHKYKVDGSDLGKLLNKMTKTKGKGVTDEIAALTPEKREKLVEILRARFNEGEQSPKTWIQQYKNIGYTVLLGNPLSALTQLGDQAFALYKNGVRSYLKALTSQKVIEKTDIGLTEAMEELFANTSKTKRVLDIFLKKSGFNKMDKFGKDMILNAAFRKYTHLAKSTKGTKEIRNKWGRYFEGETEDLIKSLKAGDIKNENVRLLLWHELADVQPIALSEMPEKYLAHPNGRIFYMLKTFTIKQLAFMRREIFSEFAKGNHVKGTANLTAFTGIWLLANGTADGMKSIIKNEDFDVADNVVENLAQMTGFSKYSMEKGMRDGPVSSVMDFVQPPVPIVDDLAKAAFSMDATKALKAIPGVGNIIYQNIKNKEKRTAARRKSTW